MAKNRKKTRPQQTQSNSNREGQQDLSPQQKYEQRHQEFIDRSISQIKSGSYSTVQSKTKDTAETRNFINTLDTLMFKARMNAGTRGARYTGHDLDTKFLPRINKAKDELNLLAAELCQLMGQPYRPPRGYKNPLQSKKPAAQQQPKGQQTQPATETAVVEIEPVAPATQALPPTPPSGLSPMTSA